jgi:REP element-mobilizing transposase RayT
MTIEPEQQHRKSIRMKGYDHSLPGAYFVTILSKRRASIFGNVVKGDVILSSIGLVVQDCWNNIPINSSIITLDDFVLMPNHLHGILIILKSDSKGEAFSKIGSTIETSLLENASPLRPRGTQSGSLGSIIQNFKSVSTRLVNRRFFEPGNKIWQRNYYERIIRNDRELNAVRQYIRNNPVFWDEDDENPANIRR